MKRRQFLAGSAAVTAGLMAPRLAPAVTAHDFAGRVVVLIELNGGSDSLNAVVPYSDNTYKKVRRQLAIKRDNVLQLDESTGLNKALEEIMPAWQAGELAVVRGVGYAQPNRSHFRSIEIVETAADTNQVLQDGWIARTFAETGVVSDLAADGVVLGGPTGPLAGIGLRTVVMTEASQFVRQAMMTPAPRDAPPRTALSHIMRQRSNILSAAGGISRRLDRAPSFGDGMFSGSEIGRQMRVAARLIAARVPLATIKIRQSGYDTHRNQLNDQTRLLGQLTEAMVAFRSAMQQSGLWDKVLVMTYAEFGRRVAQNGNGGTDHGKAASHFVMGGRVKGGLYGAQPSLTDLDDGDLRYNIDYRRLYADAVQWWKLPPAPQTLKSEKPLDLVKA